jgi:Kef-type K+ transport system membrane component KefB
MEETLVATLIQLIVIVLAARAAGSAAAALKQPRAVGEIIAGLLLGPSFLAHFFPDVAHAIFAPASAEPIRILSQIGLILLMFQIGSDFEFGHLKTAQNKRAVTFTVIASVGAPLGVGFAIGQMTAALLSPEIDKLTYSLFVAVAFAITAVPIMGRILREFQMTRVDTGVIAISSAATNDVIGWVLLAGLSAYASSQFAVADLGLKVAGILALVLGLFFIGQPIINWMIKKFPLDEGKVPTTLMAIVIALVFTLGIATQKLGIFTIFGGFLMGLLFHKHTAFVEAWRQQVGQFVLVFFLPIFFTFTGLRTNVLGLDSASDWTWCGIILASAILAKLVPVYLANRLAGLSPHQASMIGVLMNCRALMALIVLNIGFSMGFIPQDVFTMLVIMAVVTTVMTGPLIGLLMRRNGQPVGALVEA